LNFDISIDTLGCRVADRFIDLQVEQLYICRKTITFHQVNMSYAFYDVITIDNTLEYVTTRQRKPYNLKVKGSEKGNTPQLMNI
jgi:hypothetical protein